MITQCTRRLVLELGRARIARLKCHREDKANGKETGYPETETTARINELTQFIDRIETETYTPYTGHTNDGLSPNFQVMWIEYHRANVQATDEQEAIDKATALHGDITLSSTQETQARKL